MASEEDMKAEIEDLHRRLGGEALYLGDEDMEEEIESLNRRLDTCSADLLAEKDKGRRERLTRLGAKSTLQGATFPQYPVSTGDFVNSGKKRAANGGGKRRRRKSKKRKHTKKRKSKKKKTRRRRKTRR